MLGLEIPYEAGYESGKRRAWLSMLQECLRALGYDTYEGKAARWTAEREEIVQALRAACTDYGDNDWPVDLNLVDVIEKHLVRHLRRPSTSEMTAAPATGCIEKQT
jgi:transcriptional regulator with XRE-family HTH domain